MMTLTQDDLAVLESISRESSLPGEGDLMLSILIEGFSIYGEDPLIKNYKSREDFFRSCSCKLMQNISFAGKTYEQVFGEREGRDYLCRLVRSQGVSFADVEDVTQEICRKFWKSRWVERYNPLISSWRVFILKPVQRYVKTYGLRRSKKVITIASRLDQEYGEDTGSLTGWVYETDVIDTPERMLMVKELVEEWENFLSVQPQFRDVLDRGFKRLCTLLPPGIEEIPTEEERTLFFISGGPYNCRVTTLELHEKGISCMIPCPLLVDYISEDPHTKEYLRNEETGEWVTQKYYSNPDYDPKSIPVRVRKTWLDLYRCLQKGLQIEEIARVFRVAPPSVPAWIQKIEGMFRDFWLISDMVPPSAKDLALKTYKCPQCSRLDRKMRENCRACGESMKGVKGEIHLDVYPWPRAYVTRKTHERLGTKRKKMVVQRCSIS